MSDPLDGFFGGKQVRQDALKAISEAIDPAAHEGLMDIDILGQTLFPPGAFVLKDGAAVAINKMALVAAYFEVVRGVEVVGVADDVDDRDRVAEKLRSLAVLVLLQPEFLMAYNLRKTLLPVRQRHLLRLEKKFIDSLLTSPLSKHNKSPTLWSHRQWLVPRLFHYGSSDILEDLQVVMVAGEKHPRNYYAWYHARYLMALVDWSSENRKQHVRILEAVLDWCKRHHDDTSGWSFLQSLLLAEHRYLQEDVSFVLQDVRGLAQSLRWTNESVWVFLRTVTASKAARQVEYQEFSRTVAALEASTEDQTAKKVLQAAASWCLDYRGT